MGRHRAATAPQGVAGLTADERLVHVIVHALPEISASAMAEQLVPTAEPHPPGAPDGAGATPPYSAARRTWRAAGAATSPPAPARTRRTLTTARGGLWAGA
jgi:hypothetical protein